MSATCDFCGAPASVVGKDGRYYCAAHPLVGLVRARQGKVSPPPPKKVMDWAKESDDRDDDAADAGAEGAAG